MDHPADRTSASLIASNAAFLAGWLAPQLAALTLSALRVPLWARFPQAGELLALPLMLAVQVATTSVMFPSFDHWVKAAMAVLSACPMGLIAGTLGTAQFGTIVAGEIDVALWIVAIAAAAIACRSPRARGLTWAIVMMWSMGGGLLLYLRLEFLANASPIPAFLAGPLVHTIRIANENYSTLWTEFAPAAISLLILASSRARYAYGRG